VLGELGRVEAALGNRGAALEHVSAGRTVVQLIAEGVDEPELRQGFLASAAVRALFALVN
jgi:hypothetical protein